jgi:hypothetical protein
MVTVTSGETIEFILKENSFKKQRVFWLLLSLLYAFVTFVIAIFTIPHIDLFDFRLLLMNLIVVAIIMVYFLVSYSFLKQLLRSEKMILGSTYLILEKGGLFVKSSEYFDLEKIEYIRYLDKEFKLADHPLKSEHIDYFGFETQDKVIANAHKNDKLQFEYEDRTVSFGKDIFSWDYEIILQEFVTRKMRLTKDQSI